MNRFHLVSLAAAVASCVLVLPARGAVVITSTNVINGSSNNYTGASSIPVSSTDLINGLSPSATNYVGTNETNGGTAAPFTDGSAGVGPDAPTSASNALFDLGNGNWYAVYNLGSSKPIGKVVLTTGHQDGRLNQQFDILVSTDNVNFRSLSDNSIKTTLGAAGVGFNYSPSTGNGGAAQSTLSDNASATLATAQYVEFVALDAGNGVFRELDVAAAPEPGTAGIMLAGALGLFARRRRH